MLSFFHLANNILWNLCKEKENNEYEKWEFLRLAVQFSVLKKNRVKKQQQQKKNKTMQYMQS